jgi:hypothetical protein
MQLHAIIDPGLSVQDQGCEDGLSATVFVNASVTTHLIWYDQVQRLEIHRHMVYVYCMRPLWEEEKI